MTYKLIHKISHPSLTGNFMVIFLLCLGAFNTQGQIKHYQHYGVNEGLLTNRLTSVIDGVDGSIWVTAYGAGVCQFDGIRFKHFNDIETTGTLYYFSSAHGQGEDLWFGGENYLLHYNGTVFNKYPFEDAGAIRQILWYQDSLLCCIADHKSFLFSPASHRIEELMEGVVANQGVLYNDMLWLATDQGIWRRETHQWKKVYPDQEMSGCDCQKIIIDDETIYFIDEHRGLIHLDGNDSKIILSINDLPSTSITFIQPGGVGDIYFGTADQGIQILQLLDSLWLTIDEKQLQHPFVTDLQFDQWQNAWVTTDGGGLTKFYTESYNLYQNLSGKFIKQIENRSDTIEIYYQNKRSDFILPDGKLVTSNRWSAPEIILNEEAGQVKCLISGDKIITKRDSLPEELQFPFRSIHEHINDVERIDSNTALFATTEALSQIQMEYSDSASLIRRIDFLEQEINNLVRQDTSRIWFVGNNRVGVLVDGRKPVRQSIDYPVFLLKTPSGEIILGTRDRLYYLDFINDDINMTDVVSTYPLANIRSAAFDSAGELWLTLQNKLLRIRIDRSRPVEVLKVYDHQNGIPRVEFLENGLAIGINQHLYAGTSGGLLEILPETNMQSTRGPVLSLVDISTRKFKLSDLGSDKETYLQKILPTDSDVNIQLTAIDQRYPAQMRFFYQLKPKDTEWSDARENGIFQFDGLPSGKYTFVVKAKNGNNQESNILEVPFTILTPYYKQWWFLLMVFLGTSALVYLLYRKRLQSQLRKNQQMNEALQKENKILQLEQAASRLQMNPHFIFNALQSIQSSIASGHREKARSDLQAFSKLMRGYLDHARVEKILLEDEIRLLQQYLEVEKDLKNARFDYEIKVAPSIDPSFIEIPTMLIQPFVENAIKYGQPPDGGKGKIKIEFDWFGKYLVCYISDNGPGIGASMPNRESHRSAGIKITSERLETYFKKENLNPLQIKSNGPDEGALG
ncbi:MAG: histidine kinase, partial [Saprospiraceae bacterium]|nr:histidine kinase [Saprospiraceae bacterium]